MIEHEPVQILYALKSDDGRFEHPCHNPKITRLYEKGKIVKLKVREVCKGENSPYWGWLNVEDGKFCMIYPSKIQSDMCFSYGPEAAEKAGRGRQVNLVLVELEDDECS